MLTNEQIEILINELQSGESAERLVTVMANQFLVQNSVKNDNLPKGCTFEQIEGYVKDYVESGLRLLVGPGYFEVVKVAIERMRIIPVAQIDLLTK